MNIRVAWALSDGRSGVENQALGLAEAIGRLTPLKIIAHRIRLPEPWRRAPTAFAPSSVARSTLVDLAANGLPDIIIGCGRQAALATIEARRLAPPPFRVQIQRPRAPAHLFDLIVPPAHDLMSGPNVIEMIGAPGRLTREEVAKAAAALPARFGDAPRPRACALIGGPSKAHAFSAQDQDAVIAALRKIAEQGWTLFITTSRRTPRRLSDAIANEFRSPPHQLHLEGVDEGPNPYPGILGAADAVIVTADSVNMASEAAAAGRAVSLLPISQRPLASRKLGKFHAALIGHGAAKWFDGDPSLPEAPVFDETARVAEAALARWRAHPSWGRRP